MYFYSDRCGSGISTAWMFLDYRSLLFYRFVVRDFVYDEGALAASKNEITKLNMDKKKQFVSNEKHKKPQ